VEPRIVWHSHRLVLHTTPHPLSCPHAEEPRLEPHSRALGALLRMRRLNACRVRGSSLNRWRIPISRCQTARLNAAPRVGVSSFRVGVERSGEPRRRWSDPCIFLFFCRFGIFHPRSHDLKHTHTSSFPRRVLCAQGVCTFCFAHPNRGVGGAPRDVRVRAKHPLGTPSCVKDARERAYDAACQALARRLASHSASRRA